MNRYSELLKQIKTAKGLCGSAVDSWAFKIEPNRVTATGKTCHCGRPAVGVICKYDPELARDISELVSLLKGNENER